MDRAVVVARNCLLALLAAFVFACGGGGGGGSNGGGSQGITVSVLPTSANMSPGSVRIFRATVTGTTDQEVIWSATGGEIANGVYTAPASPGAYLVRAASHAEPTKFAEAAVTVAQSGVAVTIEPQQVTIGKGDRQKFSALVTGAGNTGVSWEASSGTINPVGLYTAPMAFGEYTVIARSQVDPSVSAAAAVTVSPTAIVVKISPLNQHMGTNETVQYTATVTNAADPSVTWTATGGTIDETGNFHAPRITGQYTVTATSNQDPNRSAWTFAVVDPIVIQIKPDPMALLRGASYPYAATVFGPIDKRVTWQASGGSITPEGIYTAPQSNGSYVITATSVVDPDQSAGALVGVTDPIEIFFDPINEPPSLEPGSPWYPDAWVLEGGIGLLGYFNTPNEQQPLHLYNTASHRAIIVTYDFYAIDDWRNECATLTTNGVTWRSLGFSNTLGFTQSYPDGGQNPPGTGAIYINQLATANYSGSFINNTCYRLKAILPHQGPTIGVIFHAEVPRAATNIQMWAFKNIHVEILP